MKHTLHHQNSNYVRDTLNSAVEKADKIHQMESELIALLDSIDQQRLYVRYGFKSLRGFCIQGLKFSRTQAQRITTEVRRSQTTVNIRPKRP